MTTHNVTSVNAFNARMVSLARRLGSRAEELKVSTTSLLYPEKQTLARAAGMSLVGPGRVKKALYLRHPQNAASIRVTELKFSWKPFFERP
jgi:transcription initiation factor TFIID subunit TAF12